jgi:two-component system, OmpR family, sensor histidine kinase KdpD
VHVMANLLENAVRYSHEKTQIDIEARQVEDEIQIQVLDHGPGIAPEHLERVFEKFYRLHQSENVSGTGLGLSISRGIVEAHGGRVWAENRPGGGAIFTVALPLPMQSVNAARQKSRSRQK